VTDDLEAGPKSEPATGRGVVEIWQGSDRLWRYRFLHPGGTVIRSNRSFLTHEEAADSAVLAYPGIPVVELSEPPSAGPRSHRWRKFATFSIITGGTGLIVIGVTKFVLFVRRLAKRGKKVMGWVDVAANLRRQNRS